MADFPEQRFRALYLHNGSQEGEPRITAVNQWDGGEVPRFHLMRTAKINGWRFRSDLHGDLVRELESLCLAEPVTAPGKAPPQLMERATALLDAASPIEAEWQGPIFSLADSPLADGAAAESAVAIAPITPATTERLEAGMADWLPDVPHRTPFIAAVVEDRAVAVCASVRITDQIHEAGVETWADYRRQGFARSVVNAWAKAVRDLGALPIYSTSRENVASQGVARSLGATLVGTDFHIR